MKPSFEPIRVSVIFPMENNFNQNFFIFDLKYFKTNKSASIFCRNGNWLGIKNASNCST
jgi:hypothetical protein